MALMLRIIAPNAQASVYFEGSKIGAVTVPEGAAAASTGRQDPFKLMASTRPE